ncbi:hypothetical protein PsorP6_014482 [Peronosclerospora sorghi]|uniref:Uncharacterized protein n=1 Tax=Peronosclerospora sorghi TaxID=230839 RepID=A0ACC0VUG1_9STRA|nr:hypothetical protein PsorP6_014482 [Peronosclerospora sorghi]
MEIRHKVAVTLGYENQAAYFLEQVTTMADTTTLPPVSTTASEASDVLHLRLKTLDERVFEIVATLSMSVVDFRVKVASITSVAVARQRLIYRGKLLKDGTLLRAYDLKDGHTVHLVAKPLMEEAETSRRRPIDGPAWNLANLRSALRRTEQSSGGSDVPLDLEPLSQGIVTMRTVLSTAPSEAQRTTEGTARQFFVGQWLDVKDTVNQWLESTVMDIADGKILVHYHGWPTRWDEWIDFNSDRIAAFRTRTLHTHNTQRMSPIPSTRVPGAPRVGTNDVRRTIVDLRDLMREMMPHIDRLADLCQENSSQEVDRNVVQDNETLSDDRHSDVSEAAHLVAPLFDRLGRLLMDSVQYMDPLLRPDLRGSSQRQQDRRQAALHRGQEVSAERNAENLSNSIEAEDNLLSIRDLIATDPSATPEFNQPRRSIDVHIHAIVAPASLSSLASLTRGNRNSSDTYHPPLRVPMPSTPPIGSSFGHNGATISDNLAVDDEGDQSQVPLLGSYRRRSLSQASDSSQQRQQRAVARDLDQFLSNDFFGTSFGRSDEDSDDGTSISNAHSDTTPSARSAYRPPSPLGRITSPRSSGGGESSDTQSGVNGMIQDVAAAEERLRAETSEAVNQNDDDSRMNEDPRPSNASASSSSNSSSAFPTFLEVMRRTLSGVRSFVNNEAGSSFSDDLGNSVADLPVPSSSSSSSLSTPPLSPVRHASIEHVPNYRLSPSESIIEEDLDLDEGAIHKDVNIAKHSRRELASKVQKYATFFVENETCKDLAVVPTLLQRPFIDYNNTHYSKSFHRHSYVLLLKEINNTKMVEQRTSHTRRRLGKEQITASSGELARVEKILRALNLHE